MIQRTKIKKELVGELRWCDTPESEKWKGRETQCDSEEEYSSA